MISAKGLMKVIEVEGIKLDNKAEVFRQLESAIKEKRIYVFKNSDNEEMGFVTWLEKYADNNLYIFLNNLVILKKYKKQFNLLKLRDYLRNKYPTMLKFYWKDRKKNKFVYCN